MKSSPHQNAGDVTLVLTATVAPQFVPKLMVTQPETRAAEYASALRRWVRDSTLFKEIIWWENSGHPLAYEIATRFTRSVSVHIVRGPTFDARLGRGYGEALMLQQIAQSGVGSRYLLKCTGRLNVANTKALLRDLGSAPDIVVRLTQDLKYVDSRLFVVTSDLFSPLTANLENEINDSAGRYMEHVLARRVLRLASEGARVGFWAEWPRFIGRSAATGKRYDSVGSRILWPAEDILYRLKRTGRYL